MARVRKNGTIVDETQDVLMDIQILRDEIRGLKDQRSRVNDRIDKLQVRKTNLTADINALQDDIDWLQAQ